MTIYTIYQIVCNDSNITKTYIGSTKDMKDRIETHKSSCNSSNSKKYNYKIYKFIRANGGFTNFKFIVLKELECANEYEAYQIEQTYINELKSELNSQSSYTGLTTQEYYKKYNQENKEMISQQKKQYYQIHKEKILQRKNEPYCCLICGGHYTHNNILTHFKSNKHKKYLNLNATAPIK